MHRSLACLWCLDFALLAGGCAASGASRQLGEEPLACYDLALSDTLGSAPPQIPRLTLALHPGTVGENDDSLKLREATIRPRSALPAAVGDFWVIRNDSLYVFGSGRHAPLFLMRWDRAEEVMRGRLTIEPNREYQVVAHRVACSGAS